MTLWGRAPSPERERQWCTLPAAARGEAVADLASSGRSDGQVAGEARLPSVRALRERFCSCRASKATVVPCSEAGVVVCQQGAVR